MERDAPEFEFDWDSGNLGHIARHSIRPDEAEQVVLNNPLDLGMEVVEGEERDRIRVVTAFQPAKRLTQFYYTERQR